MTGVPVLAYQQFWMDKRMSLKTEYNSLVGTHPDAAASIQQLLKVLCSIEDLASCTPASVHESEECAAVVSSAEGNRESYCKALELEFVLRPTVSRPVRLGIGPPFGAHDQMLSFSPFFV
jgi:hypothetical protein